MMLEQSYTHHHVYVVSLALFNDMISLFTHIVELKLCRLDMGHGKSDTRISAVNDRPNKSFSSISFLL